MSLRAIGRLRDMQQALDDIRVLLADATLDELREDRIRRAAFERFLEVVSEASRHIPDDWKAETAPEIPWRRVADLGNVLRHAYHQIDVELLWAIREKELDVLARAVTLMLTEKASGEHR